MIEAKIPLLGNLLRESLESYRGGKCYFEPLEGNHGDQLILLGANAVLAEFAFTFVDSPDQADLIVINGGGGMFVDPWCGQLSRWRAYSQKFLSTPILVLPSSFWFGDLDFSGTLAGRVAPTTLFCRERGSLNRLNDLTVPSNVQVKLDHDMAFYLADKEPVLSARMVQSENYVLVVERFDDEQGTGSNLLTSKNFKWAWGLPAPVKRIGKAALAFARGRTSQLLKESKQASSLFPGLPADIAYRYIDVSDQHNYTFEFFVQTIAAANAVVTTRLHAGVLAAMLGKPTVLKDGSAYGKLSKIHEYSMKDWAHVQVMR